MPACSTPAILASDVREPENPGQDCRTTLGQLRIRPLEPGEDAPLRRVFAGLSPRSRFLRYQRAAPVPSASMVRALVDLRPGIHVALAAEIDGRPVGLARWIRHSTNLRGSDVTGADSAGGPTAGAPHAEIAVEVIDAMQGRGIGRRLTAAAARSALDAGIDCLTCWVDVTHGGLRHRLLSLGAEQAADDADHFRLRPKLLLGNGGPR